MFQNTRLKLTLWYMMILIFISVCFSAVIYRLMSNEVDRFARAQQLRFERRMMTGVIIPSEGPLISFEVYDPDSIVEIKHRLLLLLFIINATIWFISSGLAYLLAGKTLRPIQLMVAEQHRFISDASHELKTPLTSLRTAFEVFLRDAHSTLGEAKELITESVEEVDKLQSLSEHLLQLAQYQTPNGRSAMTSVAFDQTVKSVVKTIAPLAKKKSVIIETQLQPVTVRANKFALSDLVTILVDNAVKYSKQSTTVRVRLLSARNYGELVIADAGIGIAQKDLPHIFERFYRADEARCKQFVGGYGLGLAIAKKIVDSHNGSITVKSTVGEGTTFVVRLPRGKTPKIAN